MKKISKSINDKFIIEFIKQNYKTDEFANPDSADTKFIFTDLDENYKQCLIVGSNYASVRYNDYYCELIDSNGNGFNLNKEWREFLLAYTSGQSNQGYSIVNIKDAIVSYMLEFYTNIVATSEIVNWSNFLQSELTNNGKKAIVLFDNENFVRFNQSNDELIKPMKKGYMMSDDADLEDLNNYLLTSLDDNVLDCVLNAHTAYSSPDKEK